MDELTQMNCSKITKDTQKLNDHEIEQYLSRVPGWYIAMKDGEQSLEKAYEFPDFKQAAGFTQCLADLAEAEDHHPAILTEWGKVTVDWWTHKIRGLHLNDFIMAAKTQKLYEEAKQAV